MWMRRNKTALWTVIVYIASFLCYVPALLRRLGVMVPAGLLNLKYGFVLVPALTAALFLARERRIKDYWTSCFKGLSIRELAACAVIAFVGAVSACGYSFFAQTDLFAGAYPSAGAFAASCAYLFLTALAEEAAWRGFLCRRLAAEGRRGRAILLSGTVWAVWHIPMWTIRNALPPMEILSLLVWAVLASVVLGAFYCAFGNLFSAALLHAALNACFLAPAAVNAAVLSAGILICRAIYRKSPGKFQKSP